VKKDVLWGYLSQFLQYGAALLVLPLLLRKLTSAELGVWYVFMTISALVSMLDMGFTQTLARNVSYVMGGAKQLQKNGYELVGQGAEIDYGLLNAMIKASRRIFLVIALIGLILLAFPGSLYIFHISREQIDHQALLLTWGIFVFATVLNIFYKYYTPLLQGRGLFAEFYKSNALGNLGFIFTTAVLLQAGLSLLAVALGYFVSALIGRWLSWRYFYDKNFSLQLLRPSSTAIGFIDIFNIMWHNAWRIGLGVIGAFLILRANIFLASIYLGLATTAAYALTLQIFFMLQGISTVVFNIQLPKVAQYRLGNQLDSLKKTIKSGFGWALGLFILGTITLIFFGAEFIRVIGGQTELLPMPLLAWMGLMMFLELNHSLAAGFIVTGNQVPFVKPALISGVAIVLSSLAGLKYGGFNVGWLIGSQFVVQAAYNNWKWPLVIYKEFFNGDK
jgi:O-antigen/teichoic acid export membrane protein